MTTAIASPENLRFHDHAPPADDFRSAVIEGLSRRPRGISPKFFYDARGSRLFDAITRLPEYYPTRTEIALLREHGPEIASLLGHDSLVIELGSGSEVKIRTLLEAVSPRAYMPVDISGEHLLNASRSIAQSHPDIEVHALCADYTRPFDLPGTVTSLPRAAFYPGSSIGNFEPADATRILAGVARLLGPGGRLLIGVDLKKDPAILEAAYNDAEGVTARFNLNLLVRMRDELGAEVDPDGFRHHALYDEAQGRIEMHLTAIRPQSIRLGSQVFDFSEGDGIHTENSYKYSAEDFTALAGHAGFSSLRVWRDPSNLFSVHCLEASA